MGAHLAKTDQRAKSQRLVAGRVNVSGGTPSIAQGQGFTVTDTAAGKVTITLQKPGKQLVSVVACPIENTDATGYSCKIMGTPSATSFIVATYVADATDGALADNIPFYFQAIIQD